MRMSEVWSERLKLTAPLLAVAGIFALTSPGSQGTTLCPFALVTGTACPGCGMTRALGALLRGDFRLAFDYHPLVMLIAVQALAGWGWLMLRRRHRAGPLPSSLIPAILVGTGASLIAVWLIRLWSGSLPPV